MEQITVETLVQAPLERVWACYTEPAHITQWNAASPDWHCPGAENDLRVGGRFSSRMEAKSGTEGFDFGGTYTEVVPMKRLAYTMDEDGRSAVVQFAADGEGTRVRVSFDPETINTIEMQRGGWQAILDNFKRHVENE